MIQALNGEKIIYLPNLSSAPSRWVYHLFLTTFSFSSTSSSISSNPPQLFFLVLPPTALFAYNLEYSPYLIILSTTNAGPIFSFSNHIKILLNSIDADIILFLSQKI